MYVKNSNISCGIGELYNFDNFDYLTKKRLYYLASLGYDRSYDHEYRTFSINFRQLIPYELHQYKVLLANITDEQALSIAATKFLLDNNFELILRFQNPRTNNWNNLYKWINSNY